MGQREVERETQVFVVNACSNEHLRHFMEADERKTI